MKNQLKNYLKTFILFFGISFLLLNCEKENDIIIKQNKNQTKFKISKIGKIKIQQNKNLTNKINKLKQGLIKNNVQNEGIYSSEHNFNIDTDYATYIENADASYHSYTFVITRGEDKGSLENLLVSLQEDKSYKLLLIEYNITKQEKIDFASGKPIDFNNKISYTEINDDGIIEELFTKSGGCEQMFYEPCSSGGNADGHGPALQNDGSYCSGSDLIIDVSGCGGGSTPDDTSPGESTTSGSGTNEEENNGSDGGSYSGTTGDTTTTGSNPINITTPVAKDLSEADILNFELSVISPYNVDMSAVLDSINLPTSDSTKIANEKFLCVYDKLTTSNTFKNLFVDTFGDSDKFNVKFEIVEDLPDSLGGQTGGISRFTNGNFTGIDLTIKIDKDNLLSNSTFNVAKTTLHESIHAYLKLKLRDCNAGTSLDYINNLTLGETIKEFYDNFNCGAPLQSQHEFMFDYMLPTFQNVFTEIGNANLTSQASLDGLSNYDLQVLNNPTQPNGINIPNSHMFNWNEFYFYNSLSGLHNTEAFKNEIENNTVKYNLYRAYKYAGKNLLTKDCN